ncbi:MAG: PaaI family thioesterase [Deltaproteobacteria bacterium]|nr:PaaI family thioesterase [Deltaproteobacteria bacterium]
MEKEALRKMGQDSPYFRHLDMELLEAEDGYAKVMQGVIHGGAIASLADQAAMRAAQTRLIPGQIGKTIQMDMHYLAPARGKHLIGEGHVRKMGKRVAFSDGEVKDEKGRMVAIARCTIMILENESEEGG